MDYYNTRKLQSVLYDIQNKYYETLTIFPINITVQDLIDNNICIKPNINLADRCNFLLVAISSYWNFGINAPGHMYSLNLWKEMCAYGFRFGNPPTS